MQDEFNSFYADFSDDLYTLSYAFLFACRPLVIQLQEPLTIENAIILRRNMRPDYLSVVPKIPAGTNPRH
ncbi:hypothetical protein [Helicobacter suis]|uniref:hypothetical protein n=1 Tax=Helicobacter suis TaxID=104628 RepID=UPI0013D4AD4D|nr:hypothetical protein [Helicobacter suis]